MTFEELKQIKSAAERIHAASVAAGKWNPKPEWEAKLMDIVCDISRAVERQDKHADLSRFDFYKPKAFDHKEPGEPLSTFVVCFESFIKGTVEDCLADAVIDILDTVEGFYTDWDEEIPLCKAFTREKNVNAFGDCFSIFCVRMIRAILTNGKSPWIIHNLISLIVYCKNHDVDLRRHVQLKMKYNGIINN